MGLVTVAVCTGTSWVQGEALQTGFRTFPQSSSQDKRWGSREVGTEILEEQKKE